MESRPTNEIYLTTPVYQQNVRRYQTHHRRQFFFFFQQDSAQVHFVCNTIQLSENVIFVFPRVAR